MITELNTMEWARLRDWAKTRTVAEFRTLGLSGLYAIAKRTDQLRARLASSVNEHALLRTSTEIENLANQRTAHCDVQQSEPAEDDDRVRGDWSRHEREIHKRQACSTRDDCKPRLEKSDSRDEAEDRAVQPKHAKDRYAKERASD